MAVEVSRSHAVELRHTDDKASQWPSYPFLPLIRQTGDAPPEDLELGVIVDGHGDTVVLGNLVDAMSQAMVAGGINEPEFIAWLADIDSIEYPQFEAVLDDGWIID